MSIKSTDLFMHRAISVAIEDMRKNQYVLEDVVGDAASDPLLQEIYGVREIDKFKLFMSKRIQVTTEYDIDMAHLPAISISIGGGNEHTDKTGDALGDGYVQQQIDPGTTGGNFRTPQIALGPVTPLSYDPVNGTVVFPTNVSLSKIFDGMTLYDEINRVGYPIQVVLDDHTLMIAEGSQPNFNGMTIRSIANVVSNTNRSYFFHETVTFTCMATESAELVYLHALMIYIIGRYRMSLFDSKNFRAATVSYGPIHKVISDPNQVFGREITMTGQVEHTYIERTDQMLQGVSPQLKIGGMPQTPPGYQAQAKNQGWNSPDDPE